MCGWEWRQFWPISQFWVKNFAWLIINARDWLVEPHLKMPTSHRNYGQHKMKLKRKIPSSTRLLKLMKMLKMIILRPFLNPHAIHQVIKLPTISRIISSQELTTQCHLSQSGHRRLARPDIPLYRIGQSLSLLQIFLNDFSTHHGHFKGI